MSTVLLLVAAGARNDHSEVDEEDAEMIRILRLDRLSAAAETGRLDLLDRAVTALDRDTTSDQQAAHLRRAARHAAEYDQREAAAYLQAVLASRAFDATAIRAQAVKPL